MLTHDRLLELVRYDPETGEFTLLVDVSRGHHHKTAGEKLGRNHPLGYIQIGLDCKSYLAHRLAWFYVTGEWPKHQIDHINQDKKDNRFANLREATNSQNHQNKKSKNSNGLKGVALANGGKYRAKRWYAKIRINQRTIYLGTFDTKEDAHNAYAKAASELFGEYACLQTK